MTSRSVSKGAGKTHICVSCNFPVATYGRLLPCKHAYCLRCASTMVQCSICQGEVEQMESISGTQPLYLSPVTLQSYKTLEELELHGVELQTRMAKG